MAVFWWFFLVLMCLPISEAQDNAKVNTCNMTFTEAPGVVTSPGYPSNYPDNARCNIVIQAPTNYTVVFTFIELDIEDHFDCRYDWVGLYDGPNDGFPSLRYFCGHFPGVSMVSHGPYMTVIFSSDGSKNDRGYKASFDFVQGISDNDGNCNAMYTRAPGGVTSPNYPFDYPEAVECVTHIQAPMGQIVSLVFSDMDIEFHAACIYDSVIVYDGADDLAPDIGRFCGDVVPTEELTSSGRDLTIVFSSDVSLTSTGFSVIFDFRDQEFVISSNTSSNDSADALDKSTKTFCHCDDVCHWFQDCCHGIQPFNNQTMNVTMDLPALDLWRCTRIWVITNNSNYQARVVDYLLVSACPSWWSDNETRRLCEKSDPDVVEVVHVHDAEMDGNPIFFRNFACATCNELTEEGWSLNQYMALRACNESDEVFYNSSVHEVQPGIEIEEDNNTLCGNLVGSIGQFPSPRECISPNTIIGSCSLNDSSLNSTVLTLCQAGIGLVSVGERVYWNEFCLICNNDGHDIIDMNSISCTVPLTDDLSQIFITVDPRSNENSQLPGVFIPSNLVLGFTCPDGFSNQDGRCVPVPISWPPCAHERWNVSYAYSLANEKTSCYNMTATTAHFGVALNYLGIDTDNASCMTREIYSPINSQGYRVIKIRTKYWMDIEFNPTSSCSDFQFHFTEGCAYVPFKGDIDFCPFEEFYDDYNNFQPLRSGNLTLVQYDDRYIMPSFSRRTIIHDVNGTSGLYSSRDVLTICGVIHPFQDCLSRVIQAGTFVITSENKLIFDRLVFQPSDYTLQEDGSVKLCWSDNVSFFDFTNTQRLVSNIAFGISSMCLFATLVIYLVFPSLRNIQGLIMIHFLVTLMISQVIVEYGTNSLTTWPVLCQTIAIIGHFSFLSSFFWTNVLAWNLKCALVDALRSKSDNTSTCGRMALFYLYAIVLPALIVLASVAVHFASGDTTGPIILHYGGTRHCWIYPINANFAVMLGPMAISLLVNFILCIWIVFGFRRNLRQAESLRKSQSRQSRMEALVYLKISALLGFGWGFGFIAANTYHKSLWYVYIIINSLQGVIIFAAFGMNRRVRKLIYDRSRQSQTSSTRNAHSGK